jgi:hypothetical protein
MATASEWIALTEGEFYPVKGYLREGGGHDHYTVAVEYEIPEIQAENFEDHHHLSKEIQLLELDHTGNLEMWQLIIEQDADGDDGEFEILFFDPRPGVDPADAKIFSKKM